MDESNTSGAGVPATVEPETAEQALVMLDRARAALDAALDFQSVRHCRTIAVAAAAYAREAKDSTLIERATRLKVQAERRAGEMLIAAAADGTRKDRANLPNVLKSRGIISMQDHRATLETIGVTGNQSSQWQALARLPQGEFDEAVNAVAATDGRVTTGSVIAAAIASRPPTPPRAPTGTPRRANATQAAAEHRRATLDATPAASPIASQARTLARVVAERDVFTREEFAALGELAEVIHAARQRATFADD